MTVFGDRLLVILVPREIRTKNRHDRCTQPDEPGGILTTPAFRPQKFRANP